MINPSFNQDVWATLSGYTLYHSGNLLFLFAESLFNINILIKHCINLVMHYKFEINI